MQATPKTLFFFAGYPQDGDRILNELRAKFATHGVEDTAFAWRKQARTGNDTLFWKSVADSLVDWAFGSGAVGYCSFDGQCSQDVQPVRGRKCAGSKKPELACRRNQPSAIILLVPSDRYDLALHQFGATVLVASFEQAAFTDVAEFFQTTLEIYNNIKTIKNYVDNLPLEKKAVFLPALNFIEKGSLEFVREIMGDAGSLVAIADAAHDQLYDHSFQNPVKRQLRGGYRLKDEIFFQRDRLHNQAKLGTASREHGFHLLSAHFRFGVAVRPGMHFDVMKRNGESLHEQFTDVLTGASSVATARHLNISPCDRLL